MANVRTKSLAAELVGMALQPLYTCPAGETAILKSITFAKLAAGAVSFDLTLLRDATSRVVLREVFPVVSTVSYRELWLVLAPGDVLRGQCDAGSVQLVMSGTELEGVAD